MIYRHIHIYTYIHIHIYIHIYIYYIYIYTYIYIYIYIYSIAGQDKTQLLYSISSFMQQKSSSIYSALNGLLVKTDTQG